MEDGLQRPALCAVGKDRKRSRGGTSRRLDVMAVRRKFDIIIFIGLVLAAMAYGALRSEFRLRSDMPVEFFDGSRLPPVKRASEEKTRKAYWSCAGKQGPWKY